MQLFAQGPVCFLTGFAWYHKSDPRFSALCRVLPCQRKKPEGIFVESDMFRIGNETLEEINRFLADPGNAEVQALLRVVAKDGTPEEINA